MSVCSILKKYNVQPKKRLGQHFLISPPTIEKIVAALDIKHTDSVLEIGPGLGVMTGFVAKLADRVVAVDRDDKLLNIAREENSELKNISWIHADILTVEIEKIFQDKVPVKIIGNLPYNISSSIIFWMLDNCKYISSAVVMLQKEVVERIVASPGGKDYGILSVLVQASAKCKKLFDVSAKSFIPPPDVTSSILKLSFGPSPVDIVDKDWFRRVVKAAFGKRRKTLRNALIGAPSLGVEIKKLDEIFSVCKIDGRRRPETLTIEEFVNLSEKLI